MAYPRRALRGYLSGFGTVTAQRFVATERGSVTAPAFSIEKSGDSAKGLYGSSSTAIALATNAAFRQWWEAAVVQVANAMEFDISGATVIDINSPVSMDGTFTMESGRQFIWDPGTVGAPGMAPRGDLTAGIYSAGTGQINVATAGVQRAQITSTGGLFTGLIRGSTGLSLGAPTTVVPVAGTSLSAYGLTELNPTGGSVTMTAVPTIAAAGLVGQVAGFLNRHATNSVTLQDESVLTGSNLKTAGNDGATPAGDCVIGPGQTVMFVRGNNDSFWRQFTPVILLNA